MAKPLGRIGDGDGSKLRSGLDTGESWHATCVVTKMPLSTVKKHARMLGYKPRRRVVAAVAKNLNG
jgi:hypothetical protein